MENHLTYDRSKQFIALQLGSKTIEFHRRILFRIWFVCRLAHKSTSGSTSELKSFICYERRLHKDGRFGSTVISLYNRCKNINWVQMQSNDSIGLGFSHSRVNTNRIRWTNQLSVEVRPRIGLALEAKVWRIKLQIVMALVGEMRQNARLFSRLTLGL